MSNNGDLIDDILGYYEDHANVTTISNNRNGQTFETPLATEDEIYEIMTDFNTKKAVEVDNILAKIIKLSASELKQLLTKIIKSIEKSTFPDLMKLGKIIPTYKNPASLAD